MKAKYVGSLIGLGTCLIAAGCGGGGSNVNSLAALPDSSTLFASSSSSSSYSFASSYTGTPPLLVDLIDQADSLFWNGAIATINAHPALSSCSEWFDLQGGLYGSQTDGDAGGNGSCQMAATVGQTIRQLSDNTICYIQQMSGNDSAPVTPTPSSRDSVFAQETSDKTIRVAITGGGGGGGGGGNMDAFITVKGSENVGNVYRIELHMCAGSTLQESQVISVDRDTMEYTSSSTHSEDHGDGNNSISAKLVRGANGFEWDTTAPREGQSLWYSSGDGQTFKSYVKLDGSKLTAKGYGVSTSWGTNKNYSLMHIDGSNSKELKFLEGAFKSYNEPTCGGCSPGTFSGESEYRDTYYASASNGVFHSDISSYSIAGDSFFDSVGSVDLSSLSEFDCDSPGDVAYTVTMDFTNDPNVQAIQEICEDKAFEGDFWQMCWSNNFQTAQNWLWNNQPGGHCP